jgi:tetratricopeptide (TPR) repeat protein
VSAVRRTGAALVLLVLLATHAVAQSGVPGGTLVSRAVELERAGKNHEAVAAWREAIAAGAVLPGVLGLERVLTILGEEIELVVALDTLIPRFPDEPQLRAAQLRTLVALGRDAEADVAFRAWRDRRPQDVAPYRDYARVLLFNDRTTKADTLLVEAGERLGQTRALLLEQAQLRAALGRWTEAAEAWRETLRDQRYFEAAAAFSLSPAPAPARDSVRNALAVPGAPLAALQVVGLLEVGWGSPRAGWLVLAPLPPSDSVLSVWEAFADEVERAQAWATLRDVLAARQRVRPNPANGFRAARAALRADDPTAALELIRAAGLPARDNDALAVELEALARLGRGAEAEGVLAAAAPSIGAVATRAHARTIAWAWVRAGDVARAKLALHDAPLDADDAVAGWLALYEGDLKVARSALRYGESTTPEAVSALALLSRTTGDRSVNVGAAYLALARSDSASAVRAFETAAGELADASSLLLALAARAAGIGERSMQLWTKLLTESPSAPEAPEAHLELGRAASRRRDLATAKTHLEQLILDFPSSALVPQARRELDQMTMDAARRSP